jgi:hypothetical protein
MVLRVDLREDSNYANSEKRLEQDAKCVALTCLSVLYMMIAVKFSRRIMM